jgi:hypothetical protein
MVLRQLVEMVVLERLLVFLVHPLLMLAVVVGG